MASSSKRARLTVCAHCQHAAVLRRDGPAILLRGRLMKWQGRFQWLCAVCVGNLRPRLRAAWLTSPKRNAS